MPVPCSGSHVVRTLCIVSSTFTSAVIATAAIKKDRNTAPNMLACVDSLRKICSIDVTSVAKHLVPFWEG